MPPKSQGPGSEPTTGINPDGTPVVGTYEEIKPLIAQRDLIYDMMAAGEVLTEDIELIGYSDDISDLNEYDDLIRERGAEP